MCTVAILHHSNIYTAASFPWPGMALKTTNIPKEVIGCFHICTTMEQSSIFVVHKNSKRGNLINQSLAATCDSGWSCVATSMSSSANSNMDLFPDRKFKEVRDIISAAFTISIQTGQYHCRRWRSCGMKASRGLLKPRMLWAKATSSTIGYQMSIVDSRCLEHKVEDDNLRILHIAPQSSGLRFVRELERASLKISQCLRS